MKQGRRVVGQPHPPRSIGPIGQQPRAGRGPDSQPEPSVQTGYRIAVIESDDLVRQLAVRWLSDAGHVTFAVTVLQLRPRQKLDLIVANVAHPRNTAVLMRTLRAAHAAPVVLVSARFRRGQGPSASLALQLGVSAILPKPYTRDELLATVESVLGECVG